MDSGSRISMTKEWGHRYLEIICLKKYVNHHTGKKKPEADQNILELLGGRKRVTSEETSVEGTL